MTTVLQPALTAARTAFDQPLSTAERLSAVTHLLSSVEYMVRPEDRRPGGLNGWEHTREQVRSKTRLGQAVRDLVAREPVTQALHASRVVAAGVLVAPRRSNRSRLLANAWLVGTQLVLYPRHLFGTDGSDQVSFLVQSAATLGRAGGSDATRWAAVQFIGAQTVLSYGASGWAKLPGDAWRSGEALRGIMRTQTYGDRWLFEQLDRHPAAARLLCHSVLAMECGFPLLLLGRGRFIEAGLATMGLFHLANARFMGLSRFAWAFLATYPAARALARRTGASA
ncbi:hypothetical protein GB931_12700 [Modestobacter sp. I12A-02628]|uniref:HTTM domain-containing protein n=1 Tax=Goekera deserti TaxID=2497753 RepID=A0A7K3W9C6_9ACTN|nr:hypothetical protein [Goekera deserti]MPQ98764.1 hypothetical protein [Goekera deserti]NDI49739.1 hypothetical protein [Goekera deserti]NEL53068.1 hypothetical protein [Goekera deserti]